MAIACDFKECQIILEDVSEIRYVNIDSKEYTMCIDCHKKFTEYLGMYLYGPVRGERKRAAPLIVELSPGQIAQIQGTVPSTREPVKMTSPSYSMGSYSQVQMTAHQVPSLWSYNPVAR